MNNTIYPIPHPVTGEMFRKSSNDQVMFVHLRSETKSFNGKNARKQVRTTNMFIPTDQVGDFKSDFVEGKALPGKLVVNETLTPAYKGHEAKINPLTGDTITSNGKPVYRDVIYSQDPNCPDNLIMSDSTVVQSVAEITANAQADLPE